MKAIPHSEIIDFHRDLVGWSGLYLREDRSNGFRRLSRCNGGCIPYAIDYLRACSSNELDVLMGALPKRFYPVAFLDLMGISIENYEQAELTRIHNYLSDCALKYSSCEPPAKRAMAKGVIKRKLTDEIENLNSDSGLLRSTDIVSGCTILTSIDLGRRDLCISYSQSLFDAGSRQVNQMLMSVTSCCGLGPALWRCACDQELDLVCCSIKAFMSEFKIFIQSRATAGDTSRKK